MKYLVKGHFLVLLVLGLLSVASPAVVRGADYYVDYSSGKDSNPGTSTNSPWKHCPGDLAATQIPSKVNLAGGDTVHFLKGSVYKLEKAPGIIVQWSGSASAPITYEGASWGSGTTNAQITSIYDSNGVQQAGDYRGFMNQPGLPFRGVTISSFEIGPIGGALVLPADKGVAAPAVAGYGILAYQTPLQDVVVSNCSFHELGYWFNQKPMSFEGGSFAGCGIQCDGFSNLAITNCRFKNMSYAIGAPPKNISMGLDVGGCDFSSNIIWCVDLDIWNGAVFDNINIHDCSFHGYDKYLGSGWGGYGQCPHCDGIFYRGGPSYTWSAGTNINFYNNYFYDGGNATASIFFNGIASASVFNNVFYNASTVNGVITFDTATGNGSTNRIYNNTFVVGNGTLQVFFRSPWATNNLLIEVRNNLFYDISVKNNNSFMIGEVGFTSAEIKSTPKTIVFDNNCYSSGNPYGYFFLNGFDAPMNLDGSGSLVKGGVRRFPGWETNGFTATPAFVSLNTDPLSADFRLNSASNSLLALKGTNLTTLGWPKLLKDRAGNVRPATGGWSVGAYQVATTNKTYSYYEIDTNQFVTNLITDNVSITNTITANQHVTNQIVDNHYSTNLVNLTKGTTNLVSGDVFVTNQFVSTLYNTNIYSTNRWSTNITVFTSVVTNLFQTNQLASNVYVFHLSQTNLYSTNVASTTVALTNLFSTNIYFTNNYFTNLTIGSAPVTSTNSNTNKVSLPNVAVTPSAPARVTVVSTTTNP